MYIYKSCGRKFYSRLRWSHTSYKRPKRIANPKGEASQIFATQKAGEFEGILKNIYQTFGGCELLLTTQEKAANLIYYIIKDHPFNDGNKRIGAFMFILFLSKSKLLYKNNGEPKINGNTLAVLALLIAQSDPSQKDMIVNLTTNLLSD